MLSGEKTGWKKNWKSYTFGFCIWALLALQPMVSTFLVNLQPPTDGLYEVRGVVIRTARKDPHLTVKTGTGDVVNFEFPVFLNSWGANAYVTPFGKENSGFQGCRVVMQVHTPSFTYYPRHRIWSLDCNNGAKVWGRADIEQRYWEDLRVAFCLYGFITLLIPFAVIFKVRQSAR